MSTRTFLAVTAIVLTLGLGLPLIAVAEKMQFGSAFRGSARYDLLGWTLENRGFWKEQGLEMEWIPFRGGSLMYQTVAAGKLFMGVSDVASFIQAASMGSPVVLVADIKSPEYFSLWVRGDGPVKDGKDLKGGRIGISRMGGASHAFALLITRSLGMEKEIRIISLGGDRERIAALKSGAIQAFTQTVPPVANLVASGELRELTSSKQYLPKDFIEFIYFAEKEFINRRPDIVGRALKALLKGGDFIMKDREWTKKKLMSDFGYSEGGVKLALDGLDFTGAGTPVTRKAVESTINFFVDYGIIAKEKAPNPDTLYTNKFVQ